LHHGVEPTDSRVRRRLLVEHELAAVHDALRLVLATVAGVAAGGEEAHRTRTAAERARAVVVEQGSVRSRAEACLELVSELHARGGEVGQRWRGDRPPAARGALRGVDARL